MKHHCRVLLVEDSPDDVFLFMRIAAQVCPAMSVTVAADPAEAQKVLRLVGPDEGVDLIVSDLKMPIATGIEFISWVRSEPDFKHLPTILLSSSEQPRDVRDAYHAGANLYLLKPTGVAGYKLLLQAIRQFCEDPSTRPIGDFVILKSS